ncbi:MAG TPA: hypothetical protein QF602_00250 [Candidatus Marinimicrobia bacterium]|jgi:hypothetical protein|nr:hypothetical protein [Candidatus Neomarinimicrobiota bacterium]
MKLTIDSFGLEAFSKILVEWIRRPPVSLFVRMHSTKQTKKGTNDEKRKINTYNYFNAKWNDFWTGFHIS